MYEGFREFTLDDSQDSGTSFNLLKMSWKFDWNAIYLLGLMRLKLWDCIWQPLYIKQFLLVSSTSHFVFLMVSYEVFVLIYLLRLAAVNDRLRIVVYWKIFLNGIENLGLKKFDIFNLNFRL